MKKAKSWGKKNDDNQRSSLPGKRPKGHLRTSSFVRRLNYRGRLAVNCYFEYHSVFGISALKTNFLIQSFVVNCNMICVTRLQTKEFNFLREAPCKISSCIFNVAMQTIWQPLRTKRHGGNRRLFKKSSSANPPSSVCLADP